jgi:NAD(P)-dependent dehydrogenase (short-subunit alcohol dehydrogenase family)
VDALYHAVLATGGQADREVRRLQLVLSRASNLTSAPCEHSGRSFRPSAMTSNPCPATVLITGGTGELGLACARHILSLRPELALVVTGRDLTSGAAAERELRTLATSADKVRFKPLDLSSQADVRRFVHDIPSWSLPPIAYLVLNAGMQSYSVTPRTEDGVAAVFAVNHLNQFLLTQLLRPHLAPQPRITVVSSGTHDPAQKTGGHPAPYYTSAEALAHPSSEEEQQQPALLTYTQSKLCNVYFAYELHALTHPPPPAASTAPLLSVNAFDPGWCPGTNIARAGAMRHFLIRRVLPHLLPLLQALVLKNVHTVDESGRAMAELALAVDSGRVVSGLYFEGTKPINSSELSYNEANRKELWDASVRLTTKDEAERAAFSDFSSLSSTL